jgi:hypothetical protein
MLIKSVIKVRCQRLIIVILLLIKKKDNCYIDGLQLAYYAFY